jgi:carbonic anhydrase
MRHTKRVPVIAALLCVGFFAGAVSAATSARLTGDVVIFEPTELGSAGDYAYTGPLGQTNWGRLEPRPGADNTVCVEGDRQSPIRLNARSAAGGESAPSTAPIEINYAPTKLVVENLGSTIEFPYEAGNSITIGENTFDLIQFHLHAKSEHVIGTKSYPLEIHLVHAKSATELAVLGIMVEEGEENEAFAALGSAPQLAQMIPGGEQVEYKFDTLEFNAADILPESSATYRYKGSLTTPPCTEVVDWAVFAEPIQMSEEQLDVFTGAIADLRAASSKGTNNRFTQLLNGREVVLVD